MEIVQEVDADASAMRDLPGMTPDLFAMLTEAGIRTRDDLADLSTDELMEITAQDQEAANALIMQAREHWFTQNQA